MNSFLKEQARSIHGTEAVVALPLAPHQVACALAALQEAAAGCDHFFQLDPIWRAISILQLWFSTQWVPWCYTVPTAMATATIKLHIFLILQLAFI